MIPAVAEAIARGDRDLAAVRWASYDASADDAAVFFLKRALAVRIDVQVSRALRPAFRPTEQRLVALGLRAEVARYWESRCSLSGYVQSINVAPALPAAGAINQHPSPAF